MTLNFQFLKINFYHLDQLLSSVNIFLSLMIYVICHVIKYSCKFCISKISSRLQGHEKSSHQHIRIHKSSVETSGSVTFIFWFTLVHQQAWYTHKSCIFNFQNDTPKETGEQIHSVFYEDFHTQFQTITLAYLDYSYNEVLKEKKKKQNYCLWPMIPPETFCYLVIVLQT